MEMNFAQHQLGHRGQLVHMAFTPPMFLLDTDASKVVIELVESIIGDKSGDIILSEVVVIIGICIGDDNTR